VQPSDKRDDSVPVFGGPALRTTTIAFTCPIVESLFTVEVERPAEGEIVGPDSAKEEEVAVPSSPVLAPAASVLSADYAEWIKISRATALDFCKTMLTNAAGAVPIYFAIMKYLGTENIGDKTFSRLGILPPVLFLLSAIIFAIALRPRLQSVRETDFAQFRSSRLHSLNRFMLMGLTAFALGVAIAIALAASVLKP
jgi:hypothetical protein